MARSVTFTFRCTNGHTQTYGAEGPRPAVVLCDRCGSLMLPRAVAFKLDRRGRQRPN